MRYAVISDIHSNRQAWQAVFEDIKKQGLDALIITGANVENPDLAQEPFWEPLMEVVL